MQEHNFDEILDYLCSGIMSKTERQSVRDELYDHLMCRYETNLATGMDENEAEEMAIEALGNKSALKDNLQKVHWYYPAQSLKSAFYLLIFAMILPVFSVFLGTYMFELASVASIVSLVFEFVVFFMLRTVNSKFGAAFKFCTAGTVLNILNIAVEPFLSGYVVVLAAFSGVILVLSVAKFFCLFTGIKKMIEPYGSAKIVKDTVLSFFMCNLFPVLMLLKFSDRTSDYSSFSGVFYFFMTIAYYFYFIGNMLKISDVLYRGDHEYKVDISVKNRAASALAVFIFAVVSILGADFAYSKTEINKSDNVPYTIEDFEMEQAEYERICENIASYGIDKNFVSLMPKSEIARYKNAVNKSELTESARQLLDYYGEKRDGDFASFKFSAGNYNPQNIFDYTSVSNYTVPLGYSEDGLQLVRFIKIFKVHSSASKMYKDTVMFEDFADNLDEMFPLLSDEPCNGDLLVAMKLENSRLYKRDLKIIIDYSDDPIEGFMFDVEPGIIIIYATTREIKDVSATVANVNFSYYHQKYPIIFPIRNMDELFKINSYYSNLSTFETFGYYASNHYFAMPGREYYVPAETEEKENSSKEFNGIVVF